MADTTILVVEDEVKIARLLRDYLKAAGFAVQLLQRGDEVTAQVRRQPPALIVLDIMLPGVDGLAVCRDLRQFSSVPIIMLTARADEVDRLVGLELGADDYVCKPFSPREVVARVKAVLRRSGSQPQRHRLVAGSMTLDSESREAAIDGRHLKLTPNEFGLLEIFMAHPKRVFSRSELVDQVQGYRFEGYDRTIDTHIKNLRKKIARLLPDEEVIGTVYGVGYKFNPPKG